MKTKKGYWRTRQGKLLKIKDMDRIHIYNAMCFIAGHEIYDPVYKEFKNPKDLPKWIKYLFDKRQELEMEYMRIIPLFRKNAKNRTKKK